MTRYLLPLLTLIGWSAAANTTESKCTASTFSKPSLGPGVEVVSISASEKHNFTSATAGPSFPPLSNLNFCQVQVYLSHIGADDRVLVEAWLPLTTDDWNGRFLATGGAGFNAGMFGAMLGDAVHNGWAAVSTDGGHDANMSSSPDASWFLKEDRTLDWNLVLNYGTRSAEEQILVGKSITEQYFGKKPHHSYWNGCSNGGRQGYAIAQKHPHLLDGVLASSPAVSLVDIVTADFWPQLMMEQTQTYLTNCELEYIRWKTIEACDMLDGVADGIIDDPEICDFRETDLVGDQIQCDGAAVEITPAAATLVGMIREGPKTHGGPIWHGVESGVRITGIANITITNGTRSQNPFGMSKSWVEHVLLRRSNTKLDMDSYLGLWARAGSELGALINSDSPDLSALRASGAKLLTWHGMGDPIVPYQNIISYRKKVEAIMGGAQAVDEFYRVFLAPGVEHCGGGMGAAPKEPLAALVAWVEEAEAPEVLDSETTNAQGDLVTRELCVWPGKSKYMAVGDPNRASSWSCMGGTERLENIVLGSDRTGQILGGLQDRLEGLGLGLTIG
jgi:pimeloyl-ACP methyl ester carboxylesterase